MLVFEIAQVRYLFFQFKGLDIYFNGLLNMLSVFFSFNVLFLTYAKAKRGTFQETNKNLDPPKLSLTAELISKKKIHKEIKWSKSKKSKILSLFLIIRVARATIETHWLWAINVMICLINI